MALKEEMLKPEISEEISAELLLKCSDEWKSEVEGHLVSSVITRSGLTPTFMNREAITALPFTFSVDTGFNYVCDQGESNRCWAFSSLNTVRKNISELLRLKEQGFELSQNYIYFYDQLEKSGRFLSKLINTIKLDPIDPKVASLLRQPVADNGQWFYFAEIAEKYGVVPKSIMPDTICSPDTRQLTRVLSEKLRWCAMTLREAYSGGAEREELFKKKDEMVIAVYTILCCFLGEPPKEFTFDYVDVGGTFHRIPKITPIEFFKTYGGVNFDDYIMVIHHPSDIRPYMQTYSYVGNAPKRGPHIQLNVDLPLIKQMTIEQLKGGELVVTGADVSKQNHRISGYMDANLYDNERIFNTDFTMSKKDRILFKDISAKHIMTFTGVNLSDDGSPDRWKVLNSYGYGTGIKGHYVMSDSWFDEYVLSVVINKKYAPKEVLEAYDTEPVKIDKSELY
jgi:Aminopeptidase C